MKWGLATAGLPIVAHSLTASGEGISTAERNAEPGGSIVALPSGAQVFYREDWLGAPWLDGEPVLFLHGNLDPAKSGTDGCRGWRSVSDCTAPICPASDGRRCPRILNVTRKLHEDGGRFLDAVGVGSAHIIGAKTGAPLPCSSRQPIHSVLAHWWSPAVRLVPWIPRLKILRNKSARLSRNKKRNGIFR